MRDDTRNGMKEGEGEGKSLQSESEEEAEYDYFDISFLPVSIALEL